MENIDLRYTKDPLYRRADEAVKEFVRLSDAFADSVTTLEGHSKPLWSYVDTSATTRTFGGPVAKGVKQICEAFIEVSTCARIEAQNAQELVAPLKPRVEGGLVLAHNFSVFEERTLTHLKEVKGSLIASLAASQASLQKIEKRSKAATEAQDPVKQLAPKIGNSVGTLGADVRRVVDFIDQYHLFVATMLECGADEKSINQRSAKAAANATKEGKKLIGDAQTGVCGVQLAISGEGRDDRLHALAHAYVTVYNAFYAMLQDGQVDAEFTGCMMANETRPASEILELLVNSGVVDALSYVNGQTLAGESATPSRLQLSGRPGKEKRICPRVRGTAYIVGITRVWPYGIISRSPHRSSVRCSKVSCRSVSSMPPLRPDPSTASRTVPSFRRFRTMSCKKSSSRYPC
ncbi:hypothetical protein [Streptomyces sp. NBC_01264]|uniref:hypothetical protein n=1 Tax=Streptomyces sp. NBC_01264 TaxID=2903804 RepID=UPI00225047AA|nr:hypothetical protein [Streptomyces sp. NBC_01264]MCX4781689.1 hypothetical protein [Streptomyces sp. NBC_01264]